MDSSSLDVPLNCEDEVLSEEHNNSSNNSTSEQLDRHHDHGKANKSKLIFFWRGANYSDDLLF